MNYHQILFIFFCIVALLVVAAYLASLAYLMRYLRRVHTATWADLGRPSFPGFSADLDERMRFARSGFVTLQFVLFSNRYKLLGDAKVSATIPLIRLLAVVFVPILVITIVLGEMK
jgi:hypothetical protein